MIDSINQDEVNLKVQRALELPADRRFYANSFTFAVSNVDAVLVLEFINQPVALVSMSANAAMTLRQALGAVLDRLESDIAQTVTPTDELATEPRETKS